MVTKKKTIKKEKVVLNVQVENVFVVKHSKNKVFAEQFRYSSINFTQKHLGSICGFFVVENRKKDNAYLVNYLTSELKREYFAVNKRTIVEAFEATLNKINRALAELAKNNSVSWLGHLSGVVCAYDEKNLYFSVTGKGKIFLLRNGNIVDLSEDMTSEESKTNPVKTFIDTAFGTLKNSDKLIICLEDFINVLPPKELQRSSERLNKEDFFQLIKTVLSNNFDLAPVSIITVEQKIKKEPLHTAKSEQKKISDSMLSVNVFGADAFVQKNKKPIDENKKIEQKLQKDEYIDKKTGHIYVKENLDEIKKTSSLNNVFSYIKDLSGDTFYFAQKETIKIKRKIIKYSKIKINALIKKHKGSNNQYDESKSDFVLSNENNEDMSSEVIYPDKNLKKINSKQNEIKNSTDNEINSKKSLDSKQKNNLIDKSDKNLKPSKEQEKKKNNKIKEKSSKSSEIDNSDEILDIKKDDLIANKKKNTGTAKKDSTKRNSLNTSKKEKSLTPSLQDTQIKPIKKEVSKISKNVKNQKSVLITDKKELTTKIKKIGKKLKNKQDLLKTKISTKNKSEFISNKFQKFSSTFLNKIKPKFKKLEKNSILDNIKRIIGSKAVILLFVVLFFISVPIILKYIYKDRNIIVTDNSKINESKKKSDITTSNTNTSSKQTKDTKQNEVILYNKILDEKDIISINLLNNNSLLITTKKTFIKIGQKDKKIVIDIPNNAGNIIQATFMKDLNHVFFITDKNKMYSYSPKVDEFIEQTKTRDIANSATKKLKSYLTYIYTFTNESIKRYARIEKGFDLPVVWYSGKELKKISDSAIDGNIYIISDKKLYKLSKKKLTDKQIPSEISPKFLHTNENMRYLWILDEDNHRITSHNKNDLTVNTTLEISSDMHNIKGFSIDESKKLVYIFTDKSLYKIPLSKLKN